MSEKITHTAIVDDCVHLILHSDTICKAFKECVSKHLDIAELAGGTRFGDRHNPGLLKTFRERWKNRREEAGLEKKLAFVLGWMSHRAADRNFKRVFRKLDGDCPLNPRDCSVYHDAEVMRRVYRHGEEAPYSLSIIQDDMKSHPATCAINVDDVAHLFEAMWQRTLIKFHTFIPCEEDSEAWIDNVVKYQQRLRVDIQRYADAYWKPDPNKYQRFIVEPNFYAPTDPILVLCRSLQDESSVDVDLDEAVALGAKQSQYSQALVRAFRYTVAASEYFEFKISEEELHDRLDIGKPEILPDNE